jgi:hypothetical protein
VTRIFTSGRFSTAALASDRPDGALGGNRAQVIKKSGQEPSSTAASAAEDLSNAATV